MCGIALPYARATFVKTSYSLPEKISRAPILPSISASQVVCAWTLNREVRSLALAISCEVNIVPNRMIPTSLLAASAPRTCVLELLFSAADTSMRRTQAKHVSTMPKRCRRKQSTLPSVANEGFAFKQLRLLFNNLRSDCETIVGDNTSSLRCLSLQ